MNTWPRVTSKISRSPEPFPCGWLGLEEAVGRQEELAALGPNCRVTLRAISQTL